MDTHSPLEHVAIIMDGNGRWAKKRKRPRFWGHIRGSSIVSSLVRTAANELHLKSLTLYAFSRENWSRPSQEVNVLLKLLYKFLQKEYASIVSEGLRFKVLGDISPLDKKTGDLIRSLEEESASHQKMDLNFAFNYGARQEILQACTTLIAQKKELSLENLEASLLLPHDLDLIIRTGGEQRLSNFFLWQASYAELYFEPKLWPEFTSEDLQRIYREVKNRERRFGGVVHG